MLDRPFIYLNRQTYVESIGVSVTADNVVFTFPDHAFAARGYIGEVFINLLQSIPTDTADTLPILLQTGNNTQPLTTFNGAAVTVADIAGIGVYKVFCNKQRNIAQLLTGAL